MKIYHGNLLSTEFKSLDFLNNYKILKKRESLKDPWTHYLVEINEEELENNILEIQQNLLPLKYYVHLYNEDGSEIIVILPQKIFRLSIGDKESWEKVKQSMLSIDIPERQTDPNPKRFSDEEDYFKRKTVNEG
jgi:hypothetical protein